MESNLTTLYEIEYLRTKESAEALTMSFSTPFLLSFLLRTSNAVNRFVDHLIHAPA